MHLPEAVKYIIDELNRRGHEAYAVGGCVRDTLLGREPEDWDVTTSAEPQEIKDIFPVTIDTGIRHGTVTVRIDGENYEVTTFRTDGNYADHRRPEEVYFTKSLEEDLLRRDFTINAMAWSTGHLVDLYGGQQDLANGIVRCVGDPFERFTEDALRILRAFRFAAQLDFVIEDQTREAIKAHREDLRYISAERIQTEMTKILTSPHPEIIRDMYELGVTEVILPEFDLLMKVEQHNPHHCLSAGEHTIKAMQEIQPTPVLRWTMLIHDMGKAVCHQFEDGKDKYKGHAKVSEQYARDIMNRMKMDNATSRAVTKLVRVHDDRMPAEPRTVRRAINRIGEDLFEDYCKVRRADVLAQSMYLREEKIKNLDDINALYKQILAEKQCVSLKDLAVTGSDLIAEGIEPGPEIGEILQQMLEWVIDDPAMNEKEKLLARWQAVDRVGL
ncbi:MAG: CCA tRNA nucleotidyltransferase [Lachnospiraceae bacterium]|nr:CCA tRNA nucleotidyltransferase [Lachnospiraceae bacterium]